MPALASWVVSGTCASRIRRQLARSTTLRRRYAEVRRAGTYLRWLVKHGRFADLPIERAVRMAYNVMLRRDPDAHGHHDFVHRLSVGAITRDQMVEEIRGSKEFNWVRFATSLGPSIHAGRCGFIQSLPKAARILDLGGTHQHTEHGALVNMGYPYSFDELVIVDLPAGERHPIYQAMGAEHEVTTRLGPVRYRYLSMVDLSAFPDHAFDLVYSGQSFEHVTEEDGDRVLAEVRRVLRPRGYLAVDTPNARVTRLQQAALIDPDHKIEYTYEQLAGKLERAGFTILEAKGLNYAGRSLEAGVFSLEEVAGNAGMFSEGRDCYILTFLCSS
jgi:SAM-dependent methyltransferase